jgi:hypothetical protein
MELIAILIFCHAKETPQMPENCRRISHNTRVMGTRRREIAGNSQTVIPVFETLGGFAALRSENGVHSHDYAGETPRRAVDPLDHSDAVDIGSLFQKSKLSEGLTQ